VRAGEAQYVQIGGTAGVTARLLSAASDKQPQRLTFGAPSSAAEPADATVIAHELRTSALDLELRAGLTPAHVAIALPLVTNAVLDGVDRIDYDVIGQRVIGLFDLPDGGRKQYHLTATEGVESPWSLLELGEEQARSWLAAPAIPEGERAIIEHALPLIARVHELRVEANATQAALGQIDSALRRLREPLGTTTGDAAVPLVERELELERQLEQQNGRDTDLTAQLQEAMRALTKQLAQLPAEPPG
jgi:hypothetical protein